MCCNKDGQSYYMAFFDFQPLPEQHLARHLKLIRQLETEGLPLYRADTYEAQTLFSENYPHPTEPGTGDTQHLESAFSRNGAAELVS